MSNIKPLSNISLTLAKYVKLAGKGSVLQTMPVKSNFKGLNLAPLQKDTVPKRYASQGERLKDFYNSKGVPYLLPNEEWSDKKILDTVKLVGKEVDKLMESKKLTKKTFQNAIEKLVPEVKGKIAIKDFSDLKKDLISDGLDKETVKMYLQYNALASSGANNTILYLKLKQANTDKLEQVLLKDNAEHELKHALTARLQNTSITDIYKNDNYKCVNQAKVFNKTFSMFERLYSFPINLKRTELTQEKLLKKLRFKSIENLYGSFERGLNKILKETKATGELNIGTSKKSWKQFFNCLKNASKDEKEAYLSSKRLREVNEDLDCPTDGELKPLLYAEMEKFFEKKRIQINKNFSKP